MVPSKHALLGSLLVLATTVGCGGSSGSDKTDSGAEAGSGDAGSDAGADSGPITDPTNPNYDEDAGPPVKLPASDSQTCMDATGASYTSYQDAMCWSQADPNKPTDCAGFFCNWTQDQILCQRDPKGACKSESELTLGCDMTLQDTVAQCAREHLYEATNDAFVNQTRGCAWMALDQPISSACLTCYVESALCARKNCVVQCAAGDSMDCDQCRQDAGCTPDFYKCSGDPDPAMLNPDGTSR